MQHVTAILSFILAVKSLNITNKVSLSLWHILCDIKFANFENKATYPGGLQMDWVFPKSRNTNSTTSARNLRPEAIVV